MPKLVVKREEGNKRGEWIMKVRKRIRRLILVIAATLIAYLFLVPLLFMVFTSFKGLSESISSSELLPKMWTLENYISILENTTTSPIMRWLANTIVVTVTGTVLVVAVDCFAAYALARLDLPFKKKVIVFLIWVMTIPGIVTTFPAFYLFRELDLINSFIPLIVPYSANATGVYLIYNFLVDFPVSLEEAARIDGMKEKQIYSRIILPLAKPAFITLGIYHFMNNWNDLIYPMMLTSSVEKRTLSAGLAILVGSNSIKYGPTLAATVISIAPLMILFLFCQRFFMEGIATSGMKE